MNYIATTRFNEITWDENKLWREKNNHKGCVYNVPVRISNKIPLLHNVFILEMNNSENIIMGIGLIKNQLYKKKKLSIYSDKNYNRFTYIGKYRVSRDELLREELKVIEILELAVFKGYTHLKRGQGITQLPQWVSTKYDLDMNKIMKEIFSSRFKTKAL